MPAPDYAAEISSLEAGLASGEHRIVFDDGEVTYRSAAEIREALSYFRGKAAAESTAAVPAVTVAAFTRD